MTTNYREGDRVRTPDTANFAPEWRGIEATVADQDNVASDHVVRVRHPDGYCALFKLEDLTPVGPDYSADYPVGIMVRDTHGGAIGEVVDHRYQSKGPVVRFPTGHATFPDPHGRLERVHVLTHDELHALDDALPATGDKFQERANVIIGKYLRPTVKHRFVVEVEQPADAKKMVGAEFLHAKLTTGDYTGLPVTVTEMAE